MKITTRDTVLGELNIMKADNFLSRLKGLLFTKKLAKSNCILIVPCSSVHTIGMTYPINIIFLSNNNKILDVKMNIKPNRLCFGPPLTNKIIELSTELEFISSNIIGKKFVEGDL